MQRYVQPLRALQFDRQEEIGLKILVTGRGFDAPGSHSLGIFELDQAKALQRFGHDVRFAAIDTRSPRRRRPLGLHRYELEGIPVAYAAIPSGSKPEFLSTWAQERAAAMIWSQLKKEGWRPDVIHSHFGAGFLPLARREGIPAVYTEHFSGAAAAEPDASELNRERRTYALADRLICVSDQLSEQVRRHTGADSRVIHNIVDMDVFTPPETPREPEAVFRFAAAGNLIRRKGYDLLLTAMAELTGRGLNAYLTVIGDGEERENLLAMTGRLGLGDRVRFTGRLTRQEMIPVYRGADAFVLASRMETFGVVYIEAMAAGLPVIATICGGPEDFVTPETGLLIEKENTDALAGAMAEMIRRRTDFDSDAVARYARENFSPSVIAEKLTSVYKELI